MYNAREGAGTGAQFRLLLRDVHPNGCSDWIADVEVGRRPEPSLRFPFQKISEWHHPNFWWEMRRAARHGVDWRNAIADWEDARTAVCLAGTTDVPLVPLDTLYFDRTARAWWTGAKPDQLSRVLRVLEDSSLKKTQVLARLRQSQSLGASYFGGMEARPNDTGLATRALSPFTNHRYGESMQLLEAALEAVAIPVPSYWHVPQLLLDVVELIDTLQMPERVAQAALIIAGDRGPSRPVAHTRLVQPPTFWIMPLVEETDWEPKDVATTALALRAFLLNAGIITRGTDTPLVPLNTPLRELAQLLGTAFLPGWKVEQLMSAGVSDLAGLFDEHPRVLRSDGVFLLPGDIATIHAALRMVGYRYPYSIDEVFGLHLPDEP